jgi:hypothetical protein
MRSTRIIPLAAVDSRTFDAGLDARVQARLISHDGPDAIHAMAAQTGQMDLGTITSLKVNR